VENNCQYLLGSDQLCG